jgi:hypothetical protein
MSGIVAVLAVVALLAGVVAPTRAERTVGTLRVDMAIGKAAFQIGEPVAIVMSATNTGTTPLAATTTSAQQYEVIVRQRGALIWQWSHDKAFAQVVRDIEMAPGATLTYQVTWDQRDLQGRHVEPGPYDISCVFLAALRSGPSSVEVGPVRISINH